MKKYVASKIPIAMSNANSAKVAMTIMKQQKNVFWSKVYKRLIVVKSIIPYEVAKILFKSVIKTEQETKKGFFKLCVLFQARLSRTWWHGRVNITMWVICQDQISHSHQKKILEAYGITSQY